jgi:hypothetical protein
MNMNDNDYELVARRLDGEDVELTAAQQALADEISADTEAVGMAMDIDLPGGALHRINARMSSTLSARIEGKQERSEPKPARLWLRWTSAAAAVAAAVIVAVVFMLPEPKTTIKPTPPPPDNGEQFVYNTITDEDLDFRVEAFSDELDDARTALLMDDDFSDELAMASVEQEMEELFLDDNGPETWIEQYNQEGPL